MPTTDERVAWLRATIEGDKATAEAASKGAWAYEGGSITNGHPLDQIVDWVYEDADAKHIVRHQPPHVIARCEADLEILDIHAEVLFTDLDLGIYDQPVCFTCYARMDVHHEYEEDSPEYDGWSFPLVQQPFPCRTVRALASGYRHRDGYLETWGGEEENADA